MDGEDVWVGLMGDMVVWAGVGTGAKLGAGAGAELLVEAGTVAPALGPEEVAGVTCAIWE